MQTLSLMGSLGRFMLPLLCLPLVADGRTWKTKDGKSFEGELSDFSPSRGLTLLDAKRKRIKIKTADLSAEDLVHIQQNFPELAGGKIAPADRDEKGKKPTGKAKEPAADEVISDNPSQISWPNIVVDKDNVGFRWASRSSRFYTRHFSFNGGSALDEKVALDKALRCESAYESIHHCPFLPEGLARKSADVGRESFGKDQPHTKFAVELANVQHFAGVYRHRVAQGFIQEEFITIEPSEEKWSNKAPISGILAHEISHMLTATAGPTVAIWEGFAEYVEHASYTNGTTVFKRFDEAMLKVWWHQKNRFATPSLHQFLTMPFERFGRKEDDNYCIAFLIFTYFADNEPETLKKFLKAALFDDNLMHEDAERVKNTEKALPVLLNGRKEKEVEAAISAYFKKFKIELKF